MKNSDLASDAPSSPEEKPAPVAAGTGVRAANEDSPTGGALYRMISRRPNPRILTLAVVASVFVLGAEGAYLWGFYGPDVLRAQAPEQLAVLGAALLFPLLLIWMLTYTVWRGQEMRLMSEALARTAIRLSDPEDTATGEIASIAQAVRRELDNLKSGLDEAVQSASNLKDVVTGEVAEIERGTGRAEFRTRTMEELLKRHRQNLEDLSHTLGSQSDKISRAIRDEVDAVRTVAHEAETGIAEATTRLSSQTEALSRTGEAARVGADATAAMLDRQSSRLEVVSSNALTRAEELSQRYEAQRDLISEAAQRLEKEHARLQSIFELHRDTMQAADTALAGHTAQISKAVGQLSQGIDENFARAHDKATALRESVSAELARAAEEAESTSAAVSRSAGAATRAIGATVQELKDAGSALDSEVNKSAADAISATTDRLKAATAEMREEVGRVTAAIHTDLDKRGGEIQSLIERTVTQEEDTAARLSRVMEQLGSAARTAGGDLQLASDELARRIDDLPDEAMESADALRKVLEDQVSALASIAEIVVRHARVIDRSSPAAEQPSRRAHEPLHDLPRQSPTRDDEKGERPWAMSELLAAAGDQKTDQAKPDPQMNEDAFQRASVNVFETLQSLAIDLDRALEQSPPPDLWRRYQAGERNVFTRRLYNLSGRELFDQIAAKYKKDGEFRTYVDRYVSTFEELLGAASARDRSNILVETYLTSDTGKVYLMLAQTSGKLS
ncbi:hypothetical protein FHS78_001372 [Parvibaculum indicum]|uniref:hypothetical protein n=1 Tax=Parvibaculum indicum TaxID=562969 RepID=UPI0014224913|nr:hypothetical protein [Parvibaculum indicum]NIJ41091.1 hypothetical protein [Parvibaculum indicum]